MYCYTRTKFIHRWILSSCQLNIDGQTIHVRFKKSDSEEIIDPNTLKDGYGIIVTLIGGMKI